VCFIFPVTHRLDSLAKMGGSYSLADVPPPSVSLAPPGKDET
jgi:hypothetical protein